MTEKNHYNAYKKAAHTVDEIKQVIMLYEGSINFIKQAKEAIKENDHEKRYNLINKAIAIINGLNSCLDFNEKTEETSQALDQFYQNIDMRLLYINFENDAEACDSVIEDLQTMLNAWIDIEKEVKDLKEAPEPDEIDDSSEQDSPPDAPIERIEIST